MPLSPIQSPQPAAAGTAENARGAAFMMAAMAAFAVNDALVKVVAPEIGLFQTIFLRGAAASVLIGLLAWRMRAFRGLPGRRDSGIIGLRTLGELGGTVFFLTALINMPLANATAILQSLPLAVALGAALFLREPIGWRRSLAIAAGFAGVLLIVRPGAAGFNVYALSALAAVLFIALRDLTTRRLSAGVSSVFVTFVTSCASALLGLVGTLAGDWTPVDGWVMALILASAASILLAYLFSILAMRVGEVGFTAPFRYSILIWALILGALVFGEVPDGWTIAGSVLIVATGLFTFFRERQMARRSGS
ncbi:MAG: DMT family transporter [Pseudomonadota bacterium]